MNDPQHDDQLAPIGGMYQADRDGKVSLTGDVLINPPASDTSHDLGSEDVDTPGPITIMPPVITDDVAAAVAKIAEAERAQLAQPAGNVFQGAPHFLRNIDGKEVCGSDGEDWPCNAWTSMEQDAQMRQAGYTQDMPSPKPVIPPAMGEVAAELGISPEKLSEILTRVQQ